MDPAVTRFPRLLRLAAAAAAIAAPLASAQPAADPAPEPLPGRWEYKYRILLIPAGTEYWCLKPDQVRRAFEGPCNRHHTCTYPVHEVDAGQIRLQGQWKDKRGRIAPVRGSGTYGPETIRLNFSGRTINGIPFRGTMNARRLGETCQPGDK